MLNMLLLIKLKTMNPLLDAVISMDEAHVVFTLPRSFFGACRLTYTLRVVPSTLLIRRAVEFDELIEDAIRRLLGGSLSHDNFRELQLPVIIKTLTFVVGKQSAESQSSSAYLFSKALCAGLLFKVVSSGIDMSLDANGWAPAAHTDFSERVVPGKAPSLPNF